MSFADEDKMAQEMLVADLEEELKDAEREIRQLRQELQSTQADRNVAQHIQDSYKRQINVAVGALQEIVVMCEKDASKSGISFEIYSVANKALSESERISSELQDTFGPEGKGYE